jgi:hypothetical protein
MTVKDLIKKLRQYEEMGTIASVRIEFSDGASYNDLPFERRAPLERISISHRAKASRHRHQTTQTRVYNASMPSLLDDDLAPKEFVEILKANFAVLSMNGISTCVYWSALLGSVAIAISTLVFPFTVLALTALTVPPIAVVIRATMSEREKAAWVVLTIVLILGVGRGLVHDEQQNRNAQEVILRNFDSVVAGLNQTMTQNQQNFQATMSQFNGERITLRSIRAGLNAMYRNQTRELAEAKLAALPPKIDSATHPFPSAATTPTVTVPDTLGVKAQALQLAREITDWLRLISADAPATDYSSSVDEQAKAQQFTQRLQSEWAEKFSSKAPQMLGQLKMFGALTGMYNACSSVPASGLALLNFRKSCAQFIEQGALSLR